MILLFKKEIEQKKNQTKYLPSLRKVLLFILVCYGSVCLSTHVVVRDGQVCYVSMGNFVSMLVDIYLRM